MKKIAPKRSSEVFLRAHVGHRGKECLLWPFRLNRGGYGLAVVGGVQTFASRWMCILAHGNPPTRKHEAAHSCGNARCVNPNHLRWATPKENYADRIGHGTDNRGQRNGKTRLTAADVKAIRSAPPHLKPLMERYGLSKGCISKIRGKKRWAHL